jgi:hypothetical protein
MLILQSFADVMAPASMKIKQNDNDAPCFRLSFSRTFGNFVKSGDNATQKGCLGLTHTALIIQE